MPKAGAKHTCEEVPKTRLIALQQGCRHCSIHSFEIAKASCGGPLVHEERQADQQRACQEPDGGVLAEEWDGSDHCEDDRQSIGKVLHDVVGVLDDHAHDEAAENLQAPCQQGSAAS